MAEAYGMLPKAHQPNERPRYSSSQRARGIFSWALIVLFCLGLLGSTMTVWAELYPLNTERWVEAAGPVAKNPAVSQELGDYATQLIMQKLQMEQRLTNLLPLPPMLIASLTADVRTYAHTELARFFQSNEFQQAWAQINRQTHARTLAALRGQNEHAQIAGNTVTVDLLSVIFKGAQYLSEHLPAAFRMFIHPPPLPSNADPAQQRQALAQMLGTSLPASFGQVVLYQGPQLALASRVIKLLDVLVIVLPLVTLALLVLSLLISLNRRRSLIGLGLGTALVMLLLLLLLPYAAQTLEAVLQNGLARNFAGEVLGGELNSLRVACLFLMAAGLFVALIAFLAGQRTRIGALFVNFRA